MLGSSKEIIVYEWFEVASGKLEAAVTVVKEGLNEKQSTIRLRELRLQTPMCCFTTITTCNYPFISPKQRVFIRGPPIH
jgi:hypothetical protein